MATFEVRAHMKVRAGQLEGFKKQAAELIRITREKDTHTGRPVILGGSEHDDIRQRRGRG